MQRIKKLIVFVLTTIMVLSISTSVFAAESKKSSANTLGSFEIEASISTADRITTSSVDLLTGEVSVSLIRDGDSEDVQVYMNWVGDFSISGFRFKKLTAKSTSALFPKTYGTVGNGSSYKTYNVVASPVAYRYITTITIPTDVEKAKITVSSLQVYELVNSSWISGLLASKNITIN